MDKWTRKSGRVDKWTRKSGQVDEETRESEGEDEEEWIWGKGSYQNLLQKVLSAAQTLKVDGFPSCLTVTMTTQAKHEPLCFR